MFTTLNMGLVAWDLGTDDYDHSQLADNFAAIDEHNHVPGKGVPIPSAGLQDRSVTEIKIALQAVGTPELQDNSVTLPKLAADSVNSTKIVDGSVGTAEIANAAVTAAKIDPTFLPIGSVLMWGRTDATPGGGWELMDGRPWSSITNAMGYTTGTIPNLTGHFPLGTVVNSVGSSGGSNTLNLSHTHSGPAHTHSLPDHNHSISGDGAHHHTFQADDLTFGHDLRTRTVGVPSAGGARQALFVAGQDTDGQINTSDPVPMSDPGNHNHTGTTGGVSGSLTSGSAGSGTTSSESPGLSAVDSRPSFTGLAFFMRVR